MPRRPGFTIIELLVVISIITLLVALILPRYDYARYVTRVTLCTTQMRSQWEAQTMLADINKSQFWRHNDYSADYMRSGGAPDSVWSAIRDGRFLNDGKATICPVIERYRGPSIAAGGYHAYVDSYWSGASYAGWDSNQPQIVLTYMWFAAYRTGNGIAATGPATIYQVVDGRLEPAWPTRVFDAGSNRAMITHRISGGPGGYISHNLGHKGRGLAISAADLLVGTPDQPVCFGDGHVEVRGDSEIKPRSLITSGGIGYYYY
jgi:prepilin-type N-terminal cleavage/methylation domain-containing protein